MKKDSKKKKGKKKKKSKDAKSAELVLLKELTETVQGMAEELEALKEINKSLKSDLKKIKKKNKKKKSEAPVVVTTVMEPQVLPPEKPKAKRQRKVTRAKTGPAAAKSKAAPAEKKPAEAKAKPAGSRRGRRPGPKKRQTAAKPATGPARPGGPEDLRFIQGLGARIQELLNEKGVKSFVDLAKASQASVKAVLEQAGPRFKNQDPKPLIEQAKLVKAEKWSELESLQAELMKGKKKPGPKPSK